MSRRGYGFTLIETLLALFITAIIVTILSIVFNTGLRSYRQGRDLLDITKKAQFFFSRITAEISGAIVNNRITFRGERGAVYFMSPVENSSALELCEIGYLLDGTTLKRHFVTKASRNYFEYPEGDVVYNTGTGTVNTFCTNVAAFELQYYNGSGWNSQWSETSSLPEMVEIKIEFQGEYPKNNPSQKRVFVTRVYLPNSTNNP